MTNKFPILEGEDEEITNENMYGKALCLYLENNLPKVGFEVPFYCNEDWGWWLEIKNENFGMALCIYSDPEAEGNPESYAVLPSITSEKIWSWRKFKKISVKDDVLAITNKLVELFENDNEISSISRHNEFPY